MATTVDSPARTADRVAAVYLPAMVLTTFVLAAGLTICGALAQLTPAEIWQSIVQPEASDIRQVIFHFSYLPRIVMSVLVGATLALSGAVCQETLRNPLAEPMTLGISSGASLALLLATIWLPRYSAVFGEWISLAGASAALVLTLSIAASRRFSQNATILAGLLVSMFAGAASSILTLFHQQALAGYFIWGSGALTQNDWSGVAFLAPRLLGIFIILVLFRRPIELLSLPDDSARSLGLSVPLARLVGMAIACSLAAFAVSAVGPIGFVGLAAPALVRLGGARTLKEKLVWAPIFGAGLLWLTDQLVLQLSTTWLDMPTGNFTALIGAPLMLFMLTHRRHPENDPGSIREAAAPPMARPWLLIGLMAAAAALAAFVALHAGQSMRGWQWNSISEMHAYWHLRAPRTTAAFSAGALLAISGCLMQRLTGNPMASPEILGVNAGASLGIILVVMFLPNTDAQFAGAIIGAIATMALMLITGRKGSFASDRLLLTGISLTVVFGAIMNILTSLGNPRFLTLLTWAAGSTYRVTEWDAFLSCVALLAAVAAIPFYHRWLAILPLGETTARAAGVNLPKTRAVVVVLAGSMAAAATLIVGPLSFVGLMAPHIARSSGFHRVGPQLIASAFLGATIMIVADWLGRNLLFPFQVPAGLLAAGVGIPYFAFIWRSGR
ncbi:MAG TPA: Fe(3+)-hydroxamate ABC transporter permease FhuB [Rhizobium sp.]